MIYYIISFLYNLNIKMNESYCIKDKRVTPCAERSGYQTNKNGRRQFYCTCPVCGIKKVRYVKSSSSGKKKPKR